MAVTFQAKIVPPSKKTKEHENLCQTPIFQLKQNFWGHNANLIYVSVLPCRPEPSMI